MLWALLALYLFGSSSASTITVALDRAKTTIKTDIQDKARRTEMLAIVDEAEKRTKEYVKTRGKIAKELSSIAERSDVQTGDIMTVLDKLHADTEAYQDWMVRHRFALKGKMTRGEWAKVFPSEAPKPVMK